MNIINLNSHNGSYHLQSWPDNLPIPENHAIVPDTLDQTIFFPHNGFVTLETTTEERVISDNEDKETVTVVTSWEPNIEEWEKWKASLPPAPVPQPSLKERVISLEEQLAETDEVAIDLYEANLAQEAINAEQDEAIIEIYEMMGV